MPNLEFEERILNWPPQTNSGEKPDWPIKLLPKNVRKNPSLNHAPLIILSKMSVCVTPTLRTQQPKETKVTYMHTQIQLDIYLFNFLFFCILFCFLAFIFS